MVCGAASRRVRSPSAPRSACPEAVSHHAYACTRLAVTLSRPPSASAVRSAGVLRCVPVAPSGVAVHRARSHHDGCSTAADAAGVAPIGLLIWLDTAPPGRLGPGHGTFRKILGLSICPTGIRWPQCRYRNRCVPAWLKAGVPRRHRALPQLGGTVSARWGSGSTHVVTFGSASIAPGAPPTCFSRAAHTDLAPMTERWVDDGRPLAAASWSP